MKLIISKTENWSEGQIDITVEDVDIKTLKAIRDTVDMEMGITPRPVVYDEKPYVKVEDMPASQHQALLIAATLHYQYYVDTSFQAVSHNKINTIKFIRTLTNTMSLLEAKQLVEYANGGTKPSWFKEEHV